jgi:hypothetical protein
VTRFPYFWYPCSASDQSVLPINPCVYCRSSTLDEHSTQYTTPVSLAGFHLFEIRCYFPANDISGAVWPINPALRCSLALEHKGKGGTGPLKGSITKAGSWRRCLERSRRDHTVWRMHAHWSRAMVHRQ